MTALAWNLKAWFALMIRKRERRDQLLRMEFRAFLQNLIWIPCQIVTRGRQIIYRVLGYNRWITDFFPAWNSTRRIDIQLRKGRRPSVWQMPFL